MLEGLAQHQQMLWTLWTVLPFKASHARLTTTTTDSQTTAGFWALFIVDVLMCCCIWILGFFCFLKFHLPLPSSIVCVDLARFGWSCRVTWQHGCYIKRKPNWTSSFWVVKFMSLIVAIMIIMMTMLTKVMMMMMITSNDNDDQDQR